MRDIKSDFLGIIRSFGLVFGDIGTSPIYTLTVIFLLLKPTAENVIGVLSLIIWTLVLLVTVEYSWLAMSLSKKGEGGDIVLREILISLLKSSRKIAFFTLLTFISVSLLIGDGVITPAISILSAVEGMLLIPGLQNLHQGALIFIAATIAIVLFTFQKKGTEKVSGAFGPIMTIWFLILAVSGIFSIIDFPQVLKAVNPYYGINFIVQNGLAGFFVLSEVILCATGGEALYADMGHLGRVPIVRAWFFVFFALVINYIGQGAFVVAHPETKNILFGMILHQCHFLYIPFLILSIMATIIASQAMISGMFSIVFQGITTHIMPMFKVDYTSEKLRSQIYIGFVNWFLLTFVILLMFIFKESKNLAAAYGFAVTGTMSITGSLMISIFYLKKKYFKFSMAIFVTLVNLIFFTANLNKIPHGGYWSIIISLLPLFVILVYTQGQKMLYKSLKPMPLEVFLKKFIDKYTNSAKLSGTALFFARDINRVPPYIVNTMFNNNIIYEDNLVISINRLDDPFGIKGFFKENVTEGLRTFEIQAGYLEVVNVEAILKEFGVDERVIFYGVEDIVTESPIWKVFAFIKKVSPAFVQFYEMPAHKLHGVITRIEM